MIEGLIVTGTLTETSSTAGGVTERVVYQRVAKGFGNITTKHSFDLQRRRHVVPADPRTQSQVARRGLMAAAVARWKNTPPADRVQWAQLAKSRNIPLFSASCSDTLKNYHLVNGALVKNSPP